MSQRSNPSASPGAKNGVSYNSSKSVGASNNNSNDIYNIVVLLVDIAVLLIKFWFYIGEALVKLFVTKEQENVSGKTIVITGTGHGMGKEMALQYGALGANVICWDVNEKNNEQTVKAIKQQGGKAFGYICNVTQREELLQLATKVKQEHGFVSVVVNNAGIMPCHPLLEHTEAEIRALFDVNVLSHFWILQAFLPDMMERNEGSIVALSSCAGLFGLPNLVPYCGTKFAVRGYMSALSEELRRKNSNVKLTTIFPYMVDTGLCKNPRYRFPNAMKLIPAKEAAASIIEAQREGLEEAAVPRHFVAVEKLGRLIPKKAMRLIDDFLDTGVDSDKL